MLVELQKVSDPSNTPAGPWLVNPRHVVDVTPEAGKAYDTDDAEAQDSAGNSGQAVFSYVTLTSGREQKVEGSLRDIYKTMRAGGGR